MPRYTYTRLTVMCYHIKHFPTDQMREAVAYLKEQPQTPLVGLVGNAHIQDELFQLGAAPMLHLDRLTGMTPKQVWEVFDVQVSDQVAYFRKRFGS